MSSGEPIVLGFPDYSEQASRLAAAVGLDYAEVTLHAFPDSESLVRLPETLPAHVIFCRTLTDANQRLVELELAAATARELGATRLTLVAPYLCYMRQDKAFLPGQAVSQRIIGAWLARTFDALVTVDPHLHRTPELRKAVPLADAVEVSAASLMSDWLSGRDDRPIIVGPDAESEQWVRRIAKPGGLDYAVARKERRGDRDVTITLPDMDVAGRAIVLADDVASTGNTLAGTTRELLARGAGAVSVIVSHALFVEGAEATLRAAGVGDIVSTDSIPHASNRLRLDRLLAGALPGLSP